MVDEGLITEDEAIQRVPPQDLDQLFHPMVDPKASVTVLAKGLPASPGAATGEVVFDADEAEALKKKGHDVILVRPETSPEDYHGIVAARAVLTARGGMTSHAALVGRQMGKVCVVGCQSLQIDYDKRTVTAGETILKEGDFISVDGFTGEVMAGQIATKPSEVVQVLISKTMKPEESKTYQKFARLMEQADKRRKLKIRTNADQPDQAQQAIAFGAEGIGLCRTEHMFFGHITEFRRMILAGEDAEKTAARAKLGLVSVFVTGKYDATGEVERTVKQGDKSATVAKVEPLMTDREKALLDMLRFQREDFEGIFKAMAGRPVTIRTLDPPLHEFLPHDSKGQQDVAAKLGIKPDAVAERVKALHEFNPMLGFRGCRLAIAYPEIAEMQARAIFEAAVAAGRRTGKPVVPEVMVPLIAGKVELDLVKARIDAMAEAVALETETRVKYSVGTMIELPRAALRAGEIAQSAEFFSFGTNDLTQTTYGISRDDAASFLGTYVARGIMASDPFVSIDREGVGELMRIGVERGRKTRPKLKVGICGEHGGDPASVAFCHEIALDYVSCSPFRVPIARLAAAQAALGKGPAGQA